MEVFLSERVLVDLSVFHDDFQIVRIGHGRQVFEWVAINQKQISVATLGNSAQRPVQVRIAHTQRMFEPGRKLQRDQAIAPQFDSDVRP